MRQTGQFAMSHVFETEYSRIFLLFSAMLQGKPGMRNLNKKHHQVSLQGSWDVHKAMHKLAKAGPGSQNSKPGKICTSRTECQNVNAHCVHCLGKAYNPWPGYMFTGKLRPAEQSSKRLVPDHIPRPDYAEHPQGYPLSEQRLKGNTYIRQLDDDEIEGDHSL